MMQCNEVRVRLPGYEDESLSADERASVRAHLSACSGCRGERAQWVRSWEMLSEWRGVEPSEVLTASILSRTTRRLIEEPSEALTAAILERTAGVPGRRESRWWRPVVPRMTFRWVAVAAGIVVVGGLLALNGFDGGRSRRGTEDGVATRSVGQSVVVVEQSPRYLAVVPDGMLPRGLYLASQAIRQTSEDEVLDDVLAEQGARRVTGGHH